MSKIEFKPGQDYNNVYFMKIDAKGHSSLVSQNDNDKVDRAFDNFEEVVFRAIDEANTKYRCNIVESWGWEGDGGLCIMYDIEESKARQTALLAADIILKDLPNLNKIIARAEVTGQISVRIAIHKGSFRYKGDDRRGSIHSKQLNFCCHLEKAVPHDSIAISKEVYDIAGETKAEFTEAPTLFEENQVFLKSNREIAEIMLEWQQRANISSKNATLLQCDVPINEIGLVGIYSQRALTEKYAKLLANAKNRIWVLGIGLGGFQKDHKKAVVQKAQEGLDVRLLAADPDSSKLSMLHSDQQFALPAWCDYVLGLGEYNVHNVGNLEQMVFETNKTLNTMKSDKANQIKLKYYIALPTLALFFIDSTLFVSNYLCRVQNLKNPTFQVREGTRLYEHYSTHFLEIWNDSNLSRDAC